MPNTWSNYPCRFQTLNDSNLNGNSTYTVWATGMYRDALVNLAKDRDAKQVLNYEPGRSICYVANTANGERLLNEIYDAIVSGREVQIEDVNNNEDIRFSVENRNGHHYRGSAKRTPAVGMHVMDFVNNKGEVDSFHPGHPILKFINGPALQGSFDTRLNDLRRAINAYKK